MSKKILATHNIDIRDACRTDDSIWRSLWTDYCKFYDAVIDDTITSMTWERILEPSFPMNCRLAYVGEECAGFAITVLHAGTWVREPICYLEDLFIAPAHRRIGVGKLLLKDAISQCSLRGSARLYWHTKASNLAARQLYDQFAAADDFVRYQIKFA